MAAIVSGTVETVLLDEGGAEGESAIGSELLDAAFNGEEEPAEQLLIQHPSLTVDDAEFRAVVDDAVARLRAMPAVGQATSFYETQDATLVSEDRHVVRVPIVGSPIGDIVDEVEAISNGAGDYVVSIAGPGSLEYEDDRVLEEDFAMVLFISLGAGMIILLIAFRSVVAAMIPLATAMGAIFVTMAIAAIVSQADALNELYAEMVLLMGLAVGIDYSLFLVARSRRERASGREKYKAIDVASRTTGRAVFYAGFTVVLSIAGLMLTDNPIFISLSLGAIIVVAIAVLASLTLIPALLAVIGDGINRFKLPLPGGSGEDGRIWGYVTERVLQRPAFFAAVTAAAILALALPIVSLNPGFSAGSQAYPNEVNGKRALQLLEQHFAAGLAEPAMIVVAGSGPEVDVATEQLYMELESAPAFEAPFQTIVSQDGSVTLIQVPVVYDLDDKRSEDAVRQLRDEIIPAAFGATGTSVYVTGQTAGSMDFTAHMYSAAPYVFGFVLGLAFLLMLVMFRSVVIPLKAVTLNLLSVAAAYGVLVLVFQHGVGQDLLGFEATGRIAPWLPLFLFVILFGLSMDYHMLLLNRIKEAYDAGVSNEESVAMGIRATAGTITSAAAIMVAVFGSFALASDIELKQFGVGLGVAVFLDATVIRVILLPASMKLLGDRNWYLPTWLEWLPQAGESEQMPVKRALRGTPQPIAARTGE